MSGAFSSDRLTRLPFWLFLCSGVLAVALALYLLLQLSATSTPQRRLDDISFLIIPHHDILEQNLPQWYGNFSASQSRAVQTVFVLSPNHNHPREMKPVIPEGGALEYHDHSFVLDDRVLAAFAVETVGRDSAQFVREHGIHAHLPMIRQQFPNAKIVPILLTRNIPQGTLDAFMATLDMQFATGSAVMIGSVDFAHGVPAAVARENDAKTLSLIASNRQEELAQLGDEHLDCPGCVTTLMFLAAKYERGSPRVLYHGTANDHLPIKDYQPTTSYFVLRW